MQNAHISKLCINNILDAPINLKKMMQFGVASSAKQIKFDLTKVYTCKAVELG